jgi:hypothetical protein
MKFLKNLVGKRAATFVRVKGIISSEGEIGGLGCLMANPNDNKPAKRQDVSPSELMDTLRMDLPPQEATLRIGNARPERVPVHADQKDPGRYWVHFSDLSSELRRILDLCPEVELRVDGIKEQGGRGFQRAETATRPGPVLQWRHE